MNAVRQRRPRQEDPAHLAYVRTLPCTICGALGCDPAHIRSPAPQHGKDQTGGGRKPDDCWVLPLCRRHHDEQHSRNELAWWASYGIDPFPLAISLYASRPRASEPPRERKRREPKVKPRRPKSERKRMTGRTEIQQRPRTKAKPQRRASSGINKFSPIDGVYEEQK